MNRIYRKLVLLGATALLVTFTANFALSAPDLTRPPRPADLARHAPGFSAFMLAPNAATATGGNGNEDPYSFGHGMRFLGLMQSGAIQIDFDCSDPLVTHNPGDTCNPLLPEPQYTGFQQQNLVSITIPGRSARTIICPVITAYIQFDMTNTTGVTTTGNIRFTPSFIVTNAALNDPRAINPATGQPYNGSMVFGPLDTWAKVRLLQVGEFFEEAMEPSRFCIAGLDKANFVAEGLPPDLVDKFFRDDTTFTLQVSGDASMVSFGSVLYGIRFLGD